ncbi:TolC family protein [Vulgatibacter sp.]|uniref:TolC family protein n=1 Tax=Vulgatibacter sp. TaxID=1971226 RepID=UPI0035647BEC
MRTSATTTTTLILALALPAGAAELPAYLAAARERNESIGIAQARLQAADAAHGEAWGHLLPSLELRAGYTRNQYEAVTQLPGRTVTILPEDQLDASATLAVPLFDGAAWARLGAADASREAARASASATEREVLLAVARAYYDTLAARQVVAAAGQAVTTAEALQRTVQVRAATGTARSSDVQTARLEVARARGRLADARHAGAVAELALARLSGLDEPAEGTLAPLPLTSAAAGGERPELEAARARAREAAARRRAAGWAYAPTVVASASERWTNATGFIGEEASWAAGVSLRWNLFDSFRRESAIELADAVAREAELQASATARAIQDEEAEAHLRLAAAAEKLEAARVGAEAAAETSRLVQVSLREARATATDAVVAGSDAFAAEVELARAQADFALAQLTLRHVQGLPLLEVLP